MSPQQWVLGFDGGGTKTDAVLVATDGSLAAEETGGPSNLNTVGIPQAAQTVFDLLLKCCQKISCQSSDLYAVGVGLAGAGVEADRVEFRRHITEFGQSQNFLLTKVIVETDWRVALEGAFPTGTGIVLIAGTGSIACAKRDDGKLYRAGGRGRIVGDEGSGHALSCDALNAALRFYDGWGDRTVLFDLALQHFGVSSVEELMTKIYREQHQLVSFVPKILQAETQGDRVAHAILFRAGGELAGLVRALTMRIKPKQKLPVALMGGLLDNENVYSKMVKEKITSTLPQVVVQKPKFPAAFGAAILAFQPFKFPQ